MEKVKTYPEMNKEIKNILKLSNDDPFNLYIVARIEELEQKVKDYEKAINECIERMTHGGPGTRSFVYDTLKGILHEQAKEN